MEDLVAGSSTDHSRVAGYKKKLASKKFLLNTLIYADILMSLAPLSLKFQRETLFVSDVKPAVESCMINLKDTEEMLLGQDEEALLTKYGFCYDGECLKQNIKDKLLAYPLNTRYVTTKSESASFEAKLATEAVNRLQTCFTKRFGDCLSDNDDFFVHCLWMDPITWKEGCTEELTALHKVAEKFAVPLSHNHFLSGNIKREWKVLKHHAQNYLANHNAQELWAAIFKHRLHQFPIYVWLLKS
jgi:hypothetical protein